MSGVSGTTSQGDAAGRRLALLPLSTILLGATPSCAFNNCLTLVRLYDTTVDKIAGNEPKLLRD